MRVVSDVSGVVEIMKGCLVSIQRKCRATSHAFCVHDFDQAICAQSLAFCHSGAKSPSSRGRKAIHWSSASSC